MTPSDRFSGIARLYGAEALERLRECHVAVVGLGGVGSWTVEALVRSAVGRITLVDLDEVCVSNINRQLHATEQTIGMPKAQVLADRARSINPDVRVNVVKEFLSPDNVTDILVPTLDFVVDSVDDAPAKTAMVLECTRLGIPLTVSGGAGGRRSAAAVTVADLTEATNDGLLRRLRKRLRNDHGFESNSTWNLPTVYSPERQVFPGPNGEICEFRPQDSPARLDCATGFGAAVFVTATYGFAAASIVVGAIANGTRTVPRKNASDDAQLREV